LKAWVLTCYDEENPPNPPFSEEESQKNIEEALQCLIEVLKHHPDDASSWRLRGSIYVKTGKHKEAIADLDECLKLSK
jgi:regulator of sirC expression with transglutaminase-like and TPR domain